MKRIIFAAILISFFCHLITAQRNDDPPIAVDPVPFDRFGKLPINDQKGRFDNFLVALSKDENSKGAVVLQLDKYLSKTKKVKRLKEISKHFNLRKVNKSRITFLIYEDTDEMTTLWMFSKNKDITDLYDESEGYKIVKGIEFDQKIKEWFPKK